MKRFVTISATAMAMPWILAAAQPATISSGQLPDGNIVTVTALNDNILKITNAPAGYKAPQSRIAVLEEGGFTGNTVTSPDGAAMLSTRTGLSAFLTPQGRLIINGGDNRVLTDNGERTTDASGRHSMTLHTFGGPFHGAGERAHRFNLNGDTLSMYNRPNYGYTEGDARNNQMNISMPLLVSPAGYAVVIDDFGEATMTAGNDITYTTVSTQPVSYYFVNSPAGYDSLPEQLADLTGHQPLPPLWSLGYITSKYGYKTQHEVDSVVSALKKGGYPLDGIVLDLYWYGKEEDMGRLDWEPSQWPDPTGMLSKLKKQGVNLVAISQPYVLRNGRGVDNYNELSARGLFGKDSIGGTKEVEIWVGEGGMFDMSNPDTRAWLRERYRTLTDQGITGWWGDLGEPEKHPDGMVHANGLTNREYHNYYGNDWSDIIATLFREEYPDTRLLTLMRAGTTGLQRNNVFPWSSDVSRSWGGMQPQIKIMLGSGLSGLGYMSHDVGGFAIDPEHPVDPELYVRWLQLGLFSPVLRTHSQEFAEPYHYEAQKDIILPLIKARYEWLPYNYTLAYENSRYGMPLVRPVGMYSSHPERYSDIEDEYLWGRDVLVAPVLTAGATGRPVRLPEGLWVNYNDPTQTFRGDTTVTVAAPLDAIPLFVRGGALIPKARYAMKNTGDYRTDNYTVEYYPADECGKTEFSIFEDDLTTPGTIDRMYALLRISADNTDDNITLTAETDGGYAGMALTHHITFEIHNADAPQSVTATSGDKPVKVSHKYSSAARTLTIEATVPGDITIDIRK